MSKIPTNPEYLIIKFQPHNLPKVIKLYHQTYEGRKMPLSYFKYRLLSSPYGKPIIFLMKFRRQIVGLYAVHPMKVKIKGKDILAGYSYLTMTHPLHSGKGIFISLALKTFEEAKKKNYNFIYSFANANSYPIFIHKLGFVELKPINFITLKLSKYITGKSCARNHVFPNDLNQIWNGYKSKNKFLIKVERNQPFLDWRYKNHPIFKYFTLHQAGEFFVIFKKYETTLHIIDFFGKGNKFYHRIFEEAAKLARQLSCEDITMWLPLHHEIMKIFNKKFFERKKWQKSFFIVKLLNKKLTKDIFEIENWYYTMGDADHF